jgi:hypothetical protein
MPTCSSVRSSPRLRAHVDAEDLVELGVVDVEHRREAELPVRRPEHGVALVVDELRGQILDQRPLVRRAEHVELPGIAGGVEAHRGGHVAQLVEGVGDHADVEEPVAVHGPVGLDGVLVVWVPPAVGITQRVDDAPAVGHGHPAHVVGEAGPRHRRGGVGLALHAATADPRRSGSGSARRGVRPPLIGRLRRFVLAAGPRSAPAPGRAPGGTRGDAVRRCGPGRPGSRPPPRRLRVPRR